eukprot:CAMPEP_0170250622 /NCGR_PEP_ID=MMETSP0116_2-20130129/25130_1 /TAXON_ID=400756 /ORGANISM="Durinskia baltica, Strain CSIRO CS-38" /LENGTH=270 /DNA_ID=CAMNT_0010501563 /DNA_START=181 /DNA_END=993 /DNA_ORIENTATION=+
MIIGSAPLSFWRFKNASAEGCFGSSGSCAVAMVMLTVVGADLMILSGIELDHTRTLMVLFGYIGVNYTLVGAFKAAQAFGQANNENVIAIRRENKLEATNIDQDLSAPIAKVVVAFGAQTMLMFYYLEGLLAPLDLDGPNVRKFWASSIPIQIMAGSQMGKSFLDEMPFWVYLMQNKHQGLRKSTGLKTIQFAFPGKCEIVLRLLLSLVGNCVYYPTILFTLPVQLMSSETSMDFVKDTFAVVFIAGIDDLSEPTVLEFIDGPLLNDEDD